MKVVILFNRPSDPAHVNAASSQDVLAQVELIEKALVASGTQHELVQVSGDLSADLASILRAKPEVVFNLVETVNENPLLYPNIAGVLELLRLPFTGSGSAALAASTDKRLAKLVFRGAGLPTPGWKVFEGLELPELDDLPPPWLVKPNFEDASIGIDDDSIYHEEKRLAADLPAIWKRHGCRPVLIEQYVEGREFNLSLIETETGLTVLPAAEIDFSSFPAGKPRLVGYKAKWAEGSFEFANTPRVFHKDRESPLLARLGALALSACAALGISGYARVDFRVANAGAPYILEVNVNPCLSPDAGFMAAAKEAGLAPAQTVELILQAAMKENEVSSIQHTLLHRKRWTIPPAVVGLP